MRVLGIGNCTLDQIAVVDRLPEADVKKSMLTFSVQGGGAAATAMVSLARWDVEASFVGKVGGDERGSKIARTIGDEGVGIEDLIFETNAISQLSFIVVESGSGRKQTYVTSGSVSPIEPYELDESLLDGVGILLVDGSHPQAELKMMRAARERGITCVLDAARIEDSTAEAVALCDYLVVSERFASQFAGVGQLKSLCESLLTKGPQSVVVTLGDEGCVAMSKEDPEMIRIDAVPVEVVDRTGAGDVFHGAIVHGIVKGKSLADTVRFANAAAALACTDLGGRGAIPTLEAIDELVK